MTALLLAGCESSASPKWRIPCHILPPDGKSGLLWESLRPGISPTAAVRSPVGGFASAAEAKNRVHPDGASCREVGRVQVAAQARGDSPPGPAPWAAPRQPGGSRRRFSVPAGRALAGQVGIFILSLDWPAG